MREDFERFAKRCGYRIGTMDFSLGSRTLNLDSMNYEYRGAWNGDIDRGLIATAPCRVSFNGSEVTLKPWRQYRESIIMPESLYCHYRHQAKSDTWIARRMQEFVWQGRIDLEEWKAGQLMAAITKGRPTDGQRREGMAESIAVWNDDFWTYEAPTYERQRVYPTIRGR